ncbi:uncharacterized protein LOC132062709 [Lycium ferocissimum]|uniref:uncharacterized protein LOC132062709 n=1 Tax=Lycium ferocissimum TaxID=112874 RepID=UPI002814DE4C|nr:uncharacterized protein LOC132062709 [Lycium ferocissimum]
MILISRKRRSPLFMPRMCSVKEEYREKGFTKHCDLIAHLLVAEQNNDLLMKNHENRPTGAAPFPEVNEVYAHYSRRGKGRGRDSGRGRSRDNGQGRNNFPGVNHSSKKNYYQKGKKKDEGHGVPEARDSENKCYRCGGSGHWSHTCRTPKHLVELYQASMKRKEKNPEANFISEDQVDITHLDVADFFEHPEGKIDHLIGDGFIVKND